MGISEVSRVGNTMFGRCMMCYMLSILIIMNALKLNNIEEPYIQLE